jgi:transcriptional regulator with XRE-family HTH domain
MGLERLKQLREARDLSQEDLSAGTDISVSQISRYERGERDPSLSHLRRLSEFLGITVAELIGDAPPAASNALSEEHREALEEILLHVFRNGGIEPAERLVSVILRSVQAPKLSLPKLDFRASALARFEIESEQVQPSLPRQGSQRHRS